MKMRSIVFACLGFVATVFLFQNCSEGFKADLGTITGSSEGPQNNPNLNCTAFTQYVDCDIYPGLANIYMDNGCLAYACQVPNREPEGPSCNAQPMVCGANEDLRFSFQNNCRIEYCQPRGPTGGDDGGDDPSPNPLAGNFDLKFFDLSGSELNFVVPLYQLENVNASDVPRICDEALAFARANITSPVHEMHCIYEGQTQLVKLFAEAGGDDPTGTFDCNGIPQTLRNAIIRLYEKWFDRVPQEAGLCFHAEQYQSHVSHARMEALLVVQADPDDMATVKSYSARKSEAVDLLSAQNIPLPSGLLTARENVINDIFQEFFQRSPAWGGLHFWSNDPGTGQALICSLVSGADNDTDKNSVRSTNPGIKSTCEAGGHSVPPYL